jgi:electron transport complex protein RnfG
VKEGLRESLRAGAQLALAGLVAAALLAGTWALTHERIAAAERQAKLQALEIVLPADRYDNDPIADAVQVRAPAWLGGDTMTVSRARLAGAPSALVLEAVAPDGYAGAIKLLIAVAADGRVLGVRVTAHRETPGLGDDIEAGRSDWITRFTGRMLGDPPLPGWRVQRDGGEFEQFAGATLTPRAVVAAVRRTLQFVARHGDAVRAADAGATLSFDDAPVADDTP